MKKTLIVLIVAGLLLAGYLTHRLIDLSPYAELIHLLIMWIGSLVVSVMIISGLVRDMLLSKREDVLEEARTALVAEAEKMIERVNHLSEAEEHFRRTLDQAVEQLEQGQCPSQVIHQPILQD